MNKATLKYSVAVAASFTSITCAIAQTHHHHEHGIVRLDVAVDGPHINVLLQSPLDSFVGFERAPRTDAEKKRAEDALDALRSGVLLQPNPQAGCTLSSVEVAAPVLEGKAKEKGGHADAEASYVFTCTAIEKLTALNTLFYQTFKHTKKVEAQVIDSKGQRKVSVRKKDTAIALHAAQ